ncbi:MAG: RNA polymerase factor sigma-54 [Gemmataceae bacterium]
MSGMQLNMQISQKQEMRLAPRMIQSMEILQLPVMALEERISQELVENPALEIREPTDEELADEPGSDVVEEKSPEKEDELIISDDATDDFNRLEALERDLGEPLGEDHRPSRSFLDEASDRKHDAMSNAPSRPQSLQEYLEEQLAYLEAPDEELALIRYLISQIDARGYLVANVPEGSDVLAELAKAFDGAIAREDVEDAILTIQKLDPPGVGARDLKECLLLQITPDTPHRDMVRTLIMNHLEDIEHNRLPLIQRRTGYDINQLQLGIEVLKHFNPRPGAKYASENIPYVTPDVLVERTEAGDYEVRLVDDWIPDVHVPRSVIELAKNKANDPAARKYIRSKILAAQWLMDAVRQRKATLEKVTKAIIQRQKAFLDKGPESIEPLKMQQIADDVGVHVTTVSRAVDDKWVQTPRGIFPLKRFFGGGTHSASGEDVAWETIKNKLIEMISNEDKSDPLSDEVIVKKFEEAGFTVARRTVTKYRKMLNIPSSRQRKDWTLASK